MSSLKDRCDALHCSFKLLIHCRLTFDSCNTPTYVIKDSRPLFVRRLAPVRETTQAHTKKLSKLNSRASALAVYASPRGLPHRSARLASGSGLGFSGQACLPVRFHRKVSELFCTSLPPFPSFLGAIPVFALLPFFVPNGHRHDYGGSCLIFDILQSQELTRFLFYITFYLL